MSNNRLFTLANLITISGLVAIGLCIWAVADGQYYLGLALYVYAALTDFIDGRVARWQEKHLGKGISSAGEILDPIRDKLLILVLLTVSWKLMLIAALLELFSTFFSYRVRARAGHHLITPVSKIVTVFQAIIVGVMIAWPETIYLFGVLYLLTLVRIYSYYRKLES